MPDELDRLFDLLVRALAKDARLAVPFAASEAYVRLDPDDVREGFQREVTAVNPEVGMFRNFPDSRVLVNRLAAERFLRGQAAFAPPQPASAEDDESEPISWTSENPIPPGETQPHFEAPESKGSTPAFEL